MMRSPAAADLQEWRRLWDGYLRFYGADVSTEVTARTWKRLLDDTSSLVGRVAQSDGGLAGFTVSVLHYSTWTERPILYLEDLFVDPVRRKTGLGRALVQDAVGEARTRGCSTIYWHTRADNAAARRLYDRFTPADDFVRYRMSL